MYVDPDVTGKTLSKMSQLEAIARTKHKCGLHWQICLIMGLIFRISFWLVVNKIKTMKSWQRKMSADRVHVYIFLADAEYYIPIKLMSTINDPRDFTLRGML